MNQIRLTPGRPRRFTHAVFFLCIPQWGIIIALTKTPLTAEERRWSETEEYRVLLRMP